MKTEKSFPEIKADVAKLRMRINKNAIEAIKTKLERARYVEKTGKEMLGKILTKANNLRNEAMNDCEKLGHLDQHEYEDTEEGWDPDVGSYPISSRTRRFCRICKAELPIE